MDIRYVYVKTRADFGKQCIFDICGPNLDEEIKPNPQEMRNYIVKSPCHVGTQYSKQLALHEVQTSSVKSKNSGMYHFEGGWPKEIHPLDHETTARFRRRVEKDDEWAPKLRNLFGEMEHSILLNNTVNIHEHYFDDMIATPLTQKRDIRLVNVFPDYQTSGRSVNDIHWSADDTKMVVSYCSVDPQNTVDQVTTTYVWDLESPNIPFMTVEAPYQTLTCQFNPRDPFVLAGGLTSGQVCHWDVRTGTEPVRLSYPKFSHRYLTTAVKWVSTKTNTEFFSCSLDGQALWWDTRNLRQPIEQLIFDFDNPNDPLMERSIGASSVNFEPSMSTKFMFGLQNGIVVSGSRKVKTNAEKLSLRFYAHSGAVVSVDRNVFNPKVFLSVGNSTTRIWAEDTREGSLMTLRSQRDIPMKACWNKIRHSLFYIIKDNGQLELYDILENLKKPVVEMHLSDASLTTMAAHENGYLLAVGDKNGNVFLTESSEVLGQFERNERNLLTAGLDRNSKHVKAVDARVKEMKILKMLEAKEEPVQPEKMPKVKKKAKQQVKIKDTDKATPKDERIIKEKSRRSTPKRRVREDAPEILVAEELFFETLEKEKLKLESDEDPNLRYSTFVRQLDQKKLKQRTTEDEEKAAEEEEDTKKKKKKPRKKKAASTTMTAKRASLRSEESQDERITKIHEAISEMLMEKGVKEIMPSAKRVRRVKKKRRTKEKKFSLRLRKPCKVVCQPKVCCWRKIWRSSKDVARIRRKLQEQEVSESRDDDRTSLLDESSTIVKDTIQEMPIELTRELDVAKKELQRSKKPIGWTERKRLVSRILQARARAKRRAKKLKTARSQDKIDEKYSDLREISEKPPSSRTTAPCRPLESWTVMKEIEAFVTPKAEDSEECEKKVGKAPLEKLRAVQGRVYPRISDFQSTE